MTFQYGRGLARDAESSHAQAVIKNDGMESFMEVPNTAPNIFVKEIDNSGAAWHRGTKTFSLQQPSF